MWNIRALALTFQKLLAGLKFQTELQNDWQDKNNMPTPKETVIADENCVLFWSLPELWNLCRRCCNVCTSSADRGDAPESRSALLMARYCSRLCRVLGRQMWYITLAVKIYQSSFLIMHSWILGKWRILTRIAFFKHEISHSIKDKLYIYKQYCTTCHNRNN